MDDFGYNPRAMAGILTKWNEGLMHSRRAAFERLKGIFNRTEIDSNTWEDLETTLIQADVGIDTTESILESLRLAARTQNVKLAYEFRALFEMTLRSHLSKPADINFSTSPTIILFVGVNGSGKTTTIAKLGSKYANAGKRVMLVGADTYRAAAMDQLQNWGDRLHLPVVIGEKDSDPGAIVFDGIKSAMAKGIEYVLIDTAGRLHTRFNLMEELKKVYRVAGKALTGAPHATWLVLDATTGQNALAQSRAFKKAVNITGIILTKLDTSAKGGMVFAIQHDLNLPIVYVGLGEKPEDLIPFDPDGFVQGVIS